MEEFYIGESYSVEFTDLKTTIIVRRDNVAKISDECYVGPISTYITFHGTYNIFEIESKGNFKTITPYFRFSMPSEQFRAMAEMGINPINYLFDFQNNILRSPEMYMSDILHPYFQPYAWSFFLDRVEKWMERVNQEDH